MPGLLPAWAANAALAGVLVFVVAAYLMNRNSQFFSRAISTAEFLPALVVAGGAIVIYAAPDVVAFLGTGTERVAMVIGFIAVLGGIALWTTGD